MDTEKFVAANDEEQKMFDERFAKYRSIGESESKSERLAQESVLQFRKRKENSKKTALENENEDDTGERVDPEYAEITSVDAIVSQIVKNYTLEEQKEIVKTLRFKIDPDYMLEFYEEELEKVENELSDKELKKKNNARYIELLVKKDELDEIIEKLSVVSYVFPGDSTLYKVKGKLSDKLKEVLKKMGIDPDQPRKELKALIKQYKVAVEI